MGCASGNATYIQSGGADSIVSTRKINIADWNNAAVKLTNNMLASGVLDNLNLKQPIKMMVSNVKNKTSEVIDTTMLTNKIIMDLTNSGKVLVIKDDKATQELLEYESERTGKKIGMAKITLTGSISEDREVNSSAREVTYTFIMELNMNGTSRWIGQEQISKQSSRSTFGF
ncbi:hypothetical protein [Intestinicryptomonas porci]